ncbi:MAG: hypothetical protein ACE5GS_12685 [Kiloniellaceae bacterium]
MVSPYLLRPLRSLEEVLSRPRAQARSDGETGRSGGAERRLTGGTAAALRQQGRTLRPRVVWVNDAPPAARRAPGRPKGGRGPGG